MGEVSTALRAKEEECGKLAKERDLLAEQLAEQKELLKAARDEAGKKETALLAEFEMERSSWTDREAMLTSGFHEIEDIVDGEFLFFLSLSCRLQVRPTTDFLSASFCFGQTSSLATRKRSLEPSRLIARHGGRMAKRSPPTPPDRRRAAPEH